MDGRDECDEWGAWWLISTSLDMEWPEEEEGRNPISGLQVRCPIDQSLCAINWTEDMPQLTEGRPLSNRSVTLCDWSDRGNPQLIGRWPGPIDRVLCPINWIECTKWEVFSADQSDLLSDRSEGVGSLDMTTLNLRNFWSARWIATCNIQLEIPWDIEFNGEFNGSSFVMIKDWEVIQMLGLLIQLIFYLRWDR